MYVKKGMYNVKLAPTQVLVIGFASIILIGGLLLNLSIASQSAESVGFINALFTLHQQYVLRFNCCRYRYLLTVFGKIVILFLIQVGGLGFMILATMFFIILGKNIFKGKTSYSRGIKSV